MRSEEPLSNDSDTCVLVATVRREIYRGGDDGFAILVVKADEQPGDTTVVGTLTDLAEGDTARFVGAWMSHPRFGPQFRAETYQKVLPETAKGIEVYLSRLPDIGPVIAQRLVAHFGVETLEIIAQSPKRLREVSGVGAKRAASIENAVGDDISSRETMIFLHGLGIQSAMAHRIVRKYGMDTIETVRNNPYLLAKEIRGLGFITADQIAKAMGLPDTHPERLRAGIDHAFHKARDDGHLYLPQDELVPFASELLHVHPEDIEHTLHAMIEDDSLACVLPDKRWLGPPEHLDLERRIANRLSGLSRESAIFTPTDAEMQFAEAALGLTLDREQREAVSTALRHPVSVITGGPGTGKTTILRAALALLQRRGLSVALAAPTGRAARRLTEVTGAKARTLHRLLEFSPKLEGFQRDHRNPLDWDAVIVDEVSMVDVPLMAALCDAIPPKGRLVLVGDANQLPSVGPGLVLHDLLSSSRVPCVRLEHIYRQAQNSQITKNAHRILEGQYPSSPGSGDELSDFFLLHLDDVEDIHKAIEAMVARRIPSRFGLDPKTDVQVLVPMHRGTLGAETLNERLQALLNPDGKPISGFPRIRFGDRVIQTRNNYDLDVSNGDVGIVIGPGFEEGSICVRFDHRDIHYPSAAADDLRLAYALSIHKSQGSEYPAVIVPLHTQHFMMLRRNLLYTAVTRARKLLVLVGPSRAIGMAIKRHDAQRRYTLLNRLLDNFGDL